MAELDRIPVMSKTALKSFVSSLRSMCSCFVLFLLITDKKGFLIIQHRKKWKTNRVNEGVNPSKPILMQTELFLPSFFFSPSQQFQQTRLVQLLPPYFYCSRTHVGKEKLPQISLMNKNQKYTNKTNTFKEETQFIQS